MFQFISSAAICFLLLHYFLVEGIFDISYISNSVVMEIFFQIIFSKWQVYSTNLWINLTLWLQKFDLLLINLKNLNHFSC